MKIALVFGLLFLSNLDMARGQEPRNIKPLPSAAYTAPNATKAVVIGISNYQDPDIPDLRFADRDAEAFYNWLRSTDGCALPDSNIQLLLNEKATTAQMILSLGWLIEVCRPGDQAFIYFSGHGDVEKVTKFNRGYLLTYNSPPTAYGAGAFSLNYLQDILTTLSENEVQVFMITDACRAGKLAGNNMHGTQATTTQLSQQFANEIKILSCQPDEFSLEGEQWGGGRGCFSYNLEDALYGFADENKDGLVNLQELRRYLEDLVSKEASPHNQTPIVLGPPKTNIAAVLESVITARKAVKEKGLVAFLPVNGKGMESYLLEDQDSSIQGLYHQFLTAIDSGQLMSPPGRSANDYFNILIVNPGLIALHASMKRTLAAALMDHGQTILNKVLKTYTETSGGKWTNKLDCDHLPAYYQRAAEILGDGHYIYKDLKAKECYFLALTTQQNNYPDSSGDWLLKVQRQLLEKSLSFDSIQAAVYYQLGITINLTVLYAIEQHQKNVVAFPDWKLNQTMQEANNALRVLLIKASRYLSEKELAVYSKIVETNLDQYFSITQAFPSAQKHCYDNALFYKGFLKSLMYQVQNIAHVNYTSESQFQLLQSYRSQLSVEYTKPFAERKEIALLEEKANALEKALINTVAGFGGAFREVTWEEVQNQLKPHEAAIEFIRYNKNFPTASDSFIYAALVLLPGNKTPEFIPLFEEKSLDSLLHVVTDRRGDVVTSLYTVGSNEIVTLNRPYRSLYEMIWLPLEGALKGANKIYYSLTGLLQRLNLDAVPIDPDSILADRYRLFGLGSTRQLVIPWVVNMTNQEAILYGGIQFDTSAYSGSQSHWRYLPGTEKEVVASEKILSYAMFHPTVLKGQNATEESFKSIGKNGASPRVLHIATHGFFFPGQNDDSHQITTTNAQEPGFKTSDNPMIRSGILLAGANYTWQNGKPLNPGMEDGILTAYEISQMNFANTELVILSCGDTGLGDIQGNEGVYGLQRAFKIAGAKYLIMSLWQVPDKQTSLLMTTFYTKWLSDKMSIPDAFSSAQQEMREKYENPFYWAGFVLVE